MESGWDSRHGSGVGGPGLWVFLPSVRAAHVSPRTAARAEFFASKRMCLEKGLESHSAQQYCLFLFKRAARRRSGGARGTWKRIRSDFSPQRVAEGLLGLEVGGMERWESGQGAAVRLLEGLRGGAVVGGGQGAGALVKGNSGRNGGGTQKDPEPAQGQGHPGV